MLMFNVLRTDPQASRLSLNTKRRFLVGSHIIVTILSFFNLSTIATVIATR
jgi:hypothetical protein